MSDAEITYGTTKGLPDYKTIPDEFRFMGEGHWNKLFSRLFFGSRDGKRLVGFKPKKGIDPEQAWRHIRALMCSWEPKHEHKEAGVSYLMSQYFEDYILEDIE